VPSQNPNACATGRNPKHAAVACTQGILNLLSKDQLRGVLAHEISHVKNRDILITTIAAVVAGIISYAAMMARWAAIFGGMGRDRNSGNMFEMLALAILAPIIALIIRLAISRSREYMADESGAKLIGEGEPLATALESLHSNVGQNPMRLGSKTTSSLFIVNPFSAKGVMNLFSTHPPMIERTKRLRNMKF
jgi:heat shock protein HtpX